MGDTRPARENTLINKGESSREKHACQHVPEQRNFVQEVRRVDPNDVVWEISRVEHRAKPSNDKGYDLSTKK